jgi:hypothetical protein
MGCCACVDGKTEARIDQSYTHTKYLLDLISPGIVSVILYAGCDCARTQDWPDKASHHEPDSITAPMIAQINMKDFIKITHTHFVTLSIAKGLSGDLGRETLRNAQGDSGTYIPKGRFFR